MTYLYYRTTTSGTPQKVDAKTKRHWQHLANKENWRIVQLPNGYYQTEVSNPDDENSWSDVTRRETIEGAETAIDGSVEHFAKKLKLTEGPKVVKTFKDE